MIYLVLLFYLLGAIVTWAYFIEDASPHMKEAAVWAALGWPLVSMLLLISFFNE